MQTLTSSEKVCPGINLVDVVFFLFYDSPLPSHHIAEDMGGGWGTLALPYREIRVMRA